MKWVIRNIVRLLARSIFANALIETTGLFEIHFWMISINFCSRHCYFCGMNFPPCCARTCFGFSATAYSFAAWGSVVDLGWSKKFIISLTPRPKHIHGIIAEFHDKFRKRCKAVRYVFFEIKLAFLLLPAITGKQPAKGCPQINEGRNWWSENS